MNDRYIADENAVYETDRNYFTLIPNMVFDVGLSVYAVRLYCELKRIAGEKGKCWMSTNNLSKCCDISMGNISYAKKDLVDNGLIKINKKKCNKGIYHEITIIDIWKRNLEFNTSLSPAETVPSPAERIKNTVNKNQYIVQETLHKDMPEQPISPAKKNGDDMNKEEIMKGNELALMKGLISNKSDYANYPEDVRPWIERVCKLWGLRPPMQKSKSYWITSARELEDACGEFGVDLLDEVYGDWKSEFKGGLCPYRIVGPNSLVNTARGKAGMKRQGISGIVKQGKPEHQSRLDV